MPQALSASPAISIITIVLNDPQVAETVASVQNQDFSGRIELIVIDGASTDGTLAALAPLRGGITHLVSEPDQGIYDAMNKGLRLATGDIVGILNAGDQFQDDQVLSRVAQAFADPAVDLCYGDLVFVRPRNPAVITRYWQAGPPHPDSFQFGWMPPHPAFFVRRAVYGQFGLFDPSYGIAADIELMLRLLVKYRLKATYLPQVLVRMRAGGISNRNLVNIFRANMQCRRAFRDLGLPCSPFFIPLKLLRHAAQLFLRPSRSHVAAG